MLVPAQSESDKTLDDYAREVKALTIANGMLRTELEATQKELRHAKNLIAHIHWAIKVGFKP